MNPDVINGLNEFEIFGYYYTDEKRESCRSKVNGVSLQWKDDIASQRLRELARADFTARKYYECLEKCTESLSYAKFKGYEYAMALANRSATYFAMQKYKICLIDINLSLQADCPNDIKPKMLIRKAKCYNKMGDFKRMLETIDEFINQDYSNIPKIVKENYFSEMKALVDTKQIDVEEIPLEEVALKPAVILEENQLNRNVSASIEMNYNGNTGTDYLAGRDIPRGEVLFVDPAYSVGFSIDLESKRSTGTFICNFCCNEAKNCIPCKFCVNFVYCSEKCLNLSWTEYHQWECDIFRSKLLSGDFCLPLRTLIKAAFTGCIFQTRNDIPCDPSNDVTSYLQIFSFPLDLATFRSKCVKEFIESCEQAVILVEFLKTANFFTRLMATSSCHMDYPSLINFVGGLLIRLIIQTYRISLTMNCAASIVSVNHNDGELDVLLTRNTNFHALCPIVSGVKFSCKPNTSMYFDGTICIVKACQDIKAGDEIFRSGFNLTPMVPYFVRQELLTQFDINCNCAACLHIGNNGDILNTSLCIPCKRLTVFQSTPACGMICINCKLQTSVEAYKLMIASALSYTYARESDNLTQIVKEMIARLHTLKRFVGPYHGDVYNLSKELMLVCSKRDNIEEFKRALHNFKTCAENRNGNYDTFEYVIDLTIYWKACFTYIELQKFKLQKHEIVKMLDSFAQAVKEAKEVAEFTFPPLLRLFPPVELYLLKLQIAYVSLDV